MSKTNQNEKSDNELKYRAQDIEVLVGLEPVRKRPGMYIGDTGITGLHHLIWEVVDNSIDEAMAGFCNEIIVELLPENTVRVSDNGRGIPIETHPQTKKSCLETVITMLHAGAKFGKKSYKVAGGLHGVGVSVVNALSEWMRAEVRREGKVFFQEYQRGKATTKVEAKKDKLEQTFQPSSTGTTITFRPDQEIFPKIKFNWDLILNHLREQAYLTKKTKIVLIDKREASKDQSEKSLFSTYSFYFEGGIRAYLQHLARHKEKKHPNPFYIEKIIDQTQIEIALQYVDEFKEVVFCFANNIHNQEGGSHLSGFRTGLTRIVNAYMRKKGFLKEKEENLSGEDVREGVIAIVSVKLKEPQFEGQTKVKLGNPEIKSIVEGVIFEEIGHFLEEHPQDAKAILEKCLLASQARKAAQSARETIIRKSALEGMTLPGKLADCSSKNPNESELYIVEGDSAGGSAKQGRERRYQAIFPLRGKPLNVQRVRLSKMLKSEEIKALCIALGTGIGDQFDLKKLRYNKIILMTDSDVDGSHIRTLLLTLFNRYFPEIIIQGHLFVAKPPLYRIQKGKLIKYVYSDQEKDKVLKEIDQKQGISVQRYKGLGEMNPEELWQTTMSPQERILKKITIEDAKETNEIFDILMGEEVEPRKKFIQTHAKMVKNLDI